MGAGARVERRRTELALAQLTISLNGRSYRLACGDGEERRVRMLAEQLAAKVDKLAAEHGQIGEDRLLLMGALLLADELQDARERAEAKVRTAAAAAAGTAIAKRASA